MLRVGRAAGRQASRQASTRAGKQASRQEGMVLKWGLSGRQRRRLQRQGTHSAGKQRLEPGRRGAAAGAAVHVLSQLRQHPGCHREARPRCSWLRRWRRWLRVAAGGGGGGGGGGGRGGGGGGDDGGNRRWHHTHTASSNVCPLGGAAQQQQQQLPHSSSARRWGRSGHHNTRPKQENSKELESDA